MAERQTVRTAVYVHVHFPMTWLFFIEIGVKKKQSDNFLFQFINYFQVDIDVPSQKKSETVPHYYKHVT